LGWSFSTSQTLYKDWWEFSSPTGIDGLPQTKDVFLIFPNPAFENIHISFEDHQNSSFKIINALDEVIQTASFQNTNNTIDIYDLSSGIYSLIIFNHNNIQSKSFLKN